MGSFLDEATVEHAALERLVGESLSSDSAELRALILLAIQQVRDSLMEDADKDAVDAGDFDDTRESGRDPQVVVGVCRRLDPVLPEQIIQGASGEIGLL